MATITTASVNAETGTLTLVINTGKSEPRELEFNLPLEAKDFASQRLNFKQIKTALRAEDVNITNKEIDTFLDRKQAIERASASIEVADDTKDLSMQTRILADGSESHVIRVKEKKLTAAQRKAMLLEKDKLIEAQAAELAALKAQIQNG